MRNVLNSRGFTLFELLIVIILIGLIYGLFVSNLHNKETKSDALTLLNMKQTLLNQPFKKKSEIICLEPCKECRIYNDGEKSDADPFSLFKEHPKVYQTDYYGRLQQQQQLPLANEENILQDVCFRFRVKNNKSSSHYIVEADKKFYVFYAYMRDVNVTTSLSKAEKLFDTKHLLPKDSRDYDF
jgi:prepilin-type N-terminal cleavage/methylation domain-containing protein